MSLSKSTSTQIQSAIAAVDKFYERRLAEVDLDVKNLRSYGSPMSEVGSKTTSDATDATLLRLAGLVG